MKPHAIPPLEQLVRRERVADVLGALTPAELVVALLRAEGMSDPEIGAFLDIRQSVVRQRMIRARRRIERLVPGAARMMEGRRRCVGQSPTPGSSAGRQNCSSKKGPG